MIAMELKSLLKINKQTNNIDNKAYDLPVE